MSSTNEQWHLNICISKILKIVGSSCRKKWLNQKQILLDFVLLRSQYFHYNFVIYCSIFKILDIF